MNKLDKPCYVYWYHIPEHNDITTQGYVGVSVNPKQRDYQHRSHKYNQHMVRAFAKYGDSIKQTIVCKSTLEYCLDLEVKLRPDKNIGWNIQPGGGQAPDCSGRVHTEDTKRKISEGNKGKNLGKPSPLKGLTGRYTDEQKALIGSYHKGKTISEEHRKAISEKNSGANNFHSQSVVMKYIESDIEHTYVNYREASEDLNLPHSSVREMGRERLGKYSKKGKTKGWAVIRVGEE